MNAITKAAKMLALMPVVALAAACNGAAPTSSTSLSTDLSATDDSAGVTATGLRAKCEGVAGIQLDIDDTGKTAVWVQATYQYKPTVPAPTACPAPSWTADTKGLQVDRSNPFRAGFARSIGGAAVVTATAPNGVSQVTKVSIGGSAEAPTDAASCKTVTGVVISKVSDPDADRVRLVAQYEYSTKATMPMCSVAPAWEASRKGLTLDSKDGFQVSIPVSGGKTVVTATAPTGVKGDIGF